MARAALAALLTIVVACQDGQQRTPTAALDPETGAGHASATSSSVTLNYQPDGFSLLNERAFNSKASSSRDASGAEGWSASESQYATMSIVGDATGSASPPNVAAIRYPAGFRGESAPAITGFDFTYKNYRQLYASMFVKVSPNFQGASQHISAFFTARAAWEPRVQIGVKGAGDGALVPAVRLLWTPNDRVLTPNVKTSAVMPRGQWQRWDLVMRINTPGKRDGELYWFANGEKIAEYHDIAVLDAGERYAWDALELRPTWGGSLDVVRSEMKLFVDHVYLSGSTSQGLLNVPQGTQPPPTQAPVASVAVSTNPSSAAVGQSATATATLRDGNGNVLSGRSINWMSSNPAVATITSSGAISAVAAGSANIVATSEGKSGSASFTVTSPSPAPVASVSVSLDSSTITAGQTTKATASLRDAKGNVLTNRSVTWSSSNAGVATVNATGIVTAVAAGTANITASSEGQSGSASLTVNAQTAKVASVTVSPATVTLQPAATSQLSAVARDANGAVISGRTVQWTSSNTAVATVSATGLVKAVVAGSATVRATIDGVAGQSAVTVSSPVATLTQIIMTPASVSLNAGQTQQFSTTGRLSNGSTQAVTVTYSATGGTITSAGVYTAGSAAGTYRVIARESVTGLADTSSVAISAPTSPPPPTGSSEPTPSASSTIIFQDDFEKYDGTCLSMDAAVWRTAGGTCGSDPNGVISSPSGTGYAGSVGGVGGRSARWIWPVSTEEQFYPLEAPLSGFGGAGQAEYFTYWYKAPNFVYRTQYPRLGKKMFLLFVGDGSTGRVTINPSEFSIQPSNAAKVDSRFDHWPAGLTSEEAFLAYLTDGRWHRYTLMRLPETRDGAGDGALRLWVDGYLVIDRQRFGTYAARTSTMLLAGTFNGGSSKVQTEYYDQIVVWR